MFEFEKKSAGLLVLLVLVHSSFAQVCTGSLGDPVINVTFGKGGNPGPRLPATVTNYNYIPIDCPSDGNYTIGNSSYSCFNATWHNVTEDHTAGDSEGYMMIANASLNPGDFYLDTAKGLCGNTVYEFAAWILNLSRPSSCSGAPIKPNLTFSIETTTGTILSRYNTGQIETTTSPEWKQHGVFFTTPATVSTVVVRLTNNSIGGCGNDLVLDDITFRPCGPTVQASLIGEPLNAVDVCEGPAVSYDLAAIVSSGYSNAAYQWQLSTDSSAFVDIAGATLPNLKISQVKAGNYRYRMAVAQAGNIGSVNCRIVSNTLTLRINALPRPKASVNAPVCAGAVLQLIAAGEGNFRWTGPNSFTSAEANPVFPASLSQSGKYFVEVVSLKGCRNIDSVQVTVFPKASASVGADETICEGLRVTLAGSPGASFLWSPSRGLSSANVQNPVAIPTDTTTYTLTITDLNGCKASDSLTINVLKKPFAEAGAEAQIFEGQSTTLHGSVRGTSVRFAWDPFTAMNNAASLSPVVSPTDNTVYTLSAISDVGCGIAQDKVFVRVFKKVVIPNAFSPNGDGINDEWNIEYLSNYAAARLTVLNRYGQTVYTSTGYNRKWNGTSNGNPLPSGTYYYTLDLKNGTGVMSGWVVIVR